jgi:hypothetical protein
VTIFATCPLIGFNASVAANRALREAAEGGGTPAWLPEAAETYLEFGAHYYADEGESTLGAILASDGVAGVDFNAAAVTGAGYAGDAGGSQGGAFTGAALAAMTAGFTAVHTFTVGNDQLGVWWQAWDASFATDVAFQSSEAQTGVRDYGGGGNWVLTANNAVEGENKIAITIVPGVRASISLNGGTVVTTTATAPEAISLVYFRMDGSNVVSTAITILDPVADAALPGLSTL